LSFKKFKEEKYDGSKKKDQREEVLSTKRNEREKES